MPLAAIAKGFPEWAWTRYPRSYVSIEDSFGSQLLRLVASIEMDAPLELARVEGIARECKTLRRSRSRTLRNEALRLAKGVCTACGTDYSKILHGKGACVLQVHHRKQLRLRDTPEATRLDDLSVLCANCHAIVHFDQLSAMSVEVLRAALSAAKSAG